MAREARPTLRDNDDTGRKSFTWELTESGRGEKRKAGEGSGKHQTSSHIVGLLIPTGLNHSNQNNASAKIGEAEEDLH